MSKDVPYSDFDIAVHIPEFSPDSFSKCSHCKLRGRIEVCVVSRSDKAMSRHAMHGWVDVKKQQHKNDHFLLTDFQWLDSILKP